MTDCILVVPDLHCPYEHRDTWDFLASVKRAYKPDAIVCIGDEIDAHTLSRYEHDPDLCGAADELTAARVSLKQLWKLFPKAKACVSNHTFRAYKQAYKAGIPRAYMRDIRSVLEAPVSWQWRDEWEVDGIVFVHGDGFGGQTPQLAACERMRQNVVLGHLHHAAGAVWSHGRKDTVWGLSVGCLIDNTAGAFAYAKYQARKPALGCGVILAGVPHFVPLS